MNQIRILPEDLCNKIAAGEVVERPASVVKELLENSLDAGASEITVEIENGGAKLILIRDNGHGMSREDAFLSLERHATSKIQSDADIFALTTLGFRGEALPSIASVSRFTLKSCEDSQMPGTEIRVEGGKVTYADDVGFPVGTQIDVRNLFFNTPARRKFLRRAETEIGHIADVVTKQAIAHPDVRFLLRHNGKVLIDARIEKDIRSRVAMLLGRSLDKDLLPIDRGVSSELRVHGLIGQPALTRATTGAIYTYINGRYVRDKVVQHAILDGYRHLLMRGRYPVVVLFLEMDPAQVDVNVHPTKHEVRFRQQRDVHDFIAASIREELRPSSWTANASEPTPMSLPTGPPQTEARAEEKTAPLDFTAPRVQESRSVYGQTSEIPRPEGAPTVVSTVSSTGTNDRAVTQQRTEEAPSGYYQDLRYLGQFQSTYLLAEDGHDLVLIDQHAAHERVTYEGLRHQLQGGKIERQALLFPSIIEMDFRAAAALKEQIELLDRLGFELEPFGGKSYHLKTVPALLAMGDAELLVQDIALEIQRFSGSSLAEEALEEVLIRMACHHSVRAHQSLTATEVSSLFRAMDAIDFNAHCPHGRPVLQRLSLPEIEKMFKRL